MRKFIMILVCIGLVGCTSRTDFGECIGAFDDGEPNLHYKASVWNVILAVLLVETIIVPVWVVLDETRCPVRLKTVDVKDLSASGSGK